MPRSSRVLLLVSCVVTIGACRDRGVIIDDWGTSGYARIEGTVTRANGSRLANSTVFFLCGPETPDTFGWSAPTDASGHYTIDVNAPGPVAIPSSGMLQCRVGAPGDAPQIASVERAVPFSTTAEARPVTVVDLVEQ